MANPLYYFQVVPSSSVTGWSAALRCNDQAHLAKHGDILLQSGFSVTGKGHYFIDMDENNGVVVIPDAVRKVLSGTAIAAMINPVPWVSAPGMELDLIAHTKTPGGIPTTVVAKSDIKTRQALVYAGFKISPSGTAYLAHPENRGFQSHKEMVSHLFSVIKVASSRMGIDHKTVSITLMPQQEVLGLAPVIHTPITFRLPMLESASASMVANTDSGEAAEASVIEKNKEPSAGNTPVNFHTSSSAPQLREISTRAKGFVNESGTGTALFIPGPNKVVLGFKYIDHQLTDVSVLTETSDNYEVNTHFLIEDFTILSATVAAPLMPAPIKFIGDDAVRQWQVFAEIVNRFDNDHAWYMVADIQGSETTNTIQKHLSALSAPLTDSRLDAAITQQENIAGIAPATALPKDAAVVGKNAFGETIYSRANQRFSIIDGHEIDYLNTGSAQEAARFLAVDTEAAGIGATPAIVSYFLGQGITPANFQEAVDFVEIIAGDKQAYSSAFLQSIADAYTITSNSESAAALKNGGPEFIIFNSEANKAFSALVAQIQAKVLEFDTARAQVAAESERLIVATTPSNTPAKPHQLPETITPEIVERIKIAVSKDVRSLRAIRRASGNELDSTDENNIVLQAIMTDGLSNDSLDGLPNAYAVLESLEKLGKYPFSDAQVRDYLARIAHTQSSITSEEQSADIANYTYNSQMNDILSIIETVNASQEGSEHESMVQYDENTLENVSTTNDGGFDLSGQGDGASFGPENSGSSGQDDNGNGHTESRSGYGRVPSVGADQSEVHASGAGAGRIGSTSGRTGSLVCINDTLSTETPGEARNHPSILEFVKREKSLGKINLGRITFGGQSFDIGVSDRDEIYFFSGNQLAVGINRDGKPLLIDNRGVRSFIDGGVRCTEAVRVSPVGSISLTTIKSDYLIAKPLSLNSADFIYLTTPSGNSFTQCLSVVRSTLESDPSLVEAMEEAYGGPIDTAQTVVAAMQAQEVFDLFLRPGTNIESGVVSLPNLTEVELGLLASAQPRAAHDIADIALLHHATKNASEMAAAIADTFAYGEKNRFANAKLRQIIDTHNDEKDVIALLVGEAGITGWNVSQHIVAFKFSKRNITEAKKMAASFGRVLTTPIYNESPIHTLAGYVSTQQQLNTSTIGDDAPNPIRDAIPSEESNSEIVLEEGFGQIGDFLISKAGEYNAEIGSANTFSVTTPIIIDFRPFYGVLRSDKAWIIPMEMHDIVVSYIRDIDASKSLEKVSPYRSQVLMESKLQEYLNEKDSYKARIEKDLNPSKRDFYNSEIARIENEVNTLRIGLWINALRKYAPTRFSRAELQDVISLSGKYAGIKKELGLLIYREPVRFLQAFSTTRELSLDEIRKMSPVERDVFLEKSMVEIEPTDIPKDLLYKAIKLQFSDWSSPPSEYAESLPQLLSGFEKNPHTGPIVSTKISNEVSFLQSYIASSADLIPANKMAEIGIGALNGYRNGKGLLRQSLDSDTIIPAIARFFSVVAAKQISLTESSYKEVKPKLTDSIIERAKEIVGTTGTSSISVRSLTSSIVQAMGGIYSPSSVGSLFVSIPMSDAPSVSISVPESILNNTCNNLDQDIKVIHDFIANEAVSTLLAYSHIANKIKDKEGITIGAKIDDIEVVGVNEIGAMTNRIINPNAHFGMRNGGVFRCNDFLFGVESDIDWSGSQYNKSAIEIVMLGDKYENHRSFYITPADVYEALRSNIQQSVQNEVSATNHFLLRDAAIGLWSYSAIENPILLQEALAYSTELMTRAKPFNVVDSISDFIRDNGTDLVIRQDIKSVANYISASPVITGDYIKTTDELKNLAQEWMLPASSDFSLLNALLEQEYLPENYANKDKFKAITGKELDDIGGNWPIEALPLREKSLSNSPEYKDYNLAVELLKKSYSELNKLIVELENSPPLRVKNTYPHQSEIGLKIPEKLITHVNAILENDGILVRDSIERGIFSISFKDVNYSRTGFRPVEIGINADGEIQYITEYTPSYHNGVNEVEKSTDFDFSTNSFFMDTGVGAPTYHSLTVLGKRDASFFNIYTANLCAYLNAGAFHFSTSKDSSLREYSSSGVGIEYVPRVAPDDIDDVPVTPTEKSRDPITLDTWDSAASLKELASAVMSAKIGDPVSIYQEATLVSLPGRNAMRLLMDGEEQVISYIDAFGIADYAEFDGLLHGMLDAADREPLLLSALPIELKRELKGREFVGNKFDRYPGIYAAIENSLKLSSITDFMETHTADIKTLCEYSDLIDSYEKVGESINYQFITGIAARDNTVTSTLIGLQSSMIASLARIGCPIIDVTGPVNNQYDMADVSTQALVYLAAVELKREAATYAGMPFKTGSRFTVARDGIQGVKTVVDSLQSGWFQKAGGELNAAPDVAPYFSSDSPILTLNLSKLQEIGLIVSSHGLQQLISKDDLVKGIKIPAPVAPQTGIDMPATPKAAGSTPVAPQSGIDMPATPKAAGSTPVAPQSGIDMPATPKAAADLSEIKDHITDDEFDLHGLAALGHGDQTVKFESNIAAIKALHEVEAFKTVPSAEQKQLLAGYVGWGGLPHAFRVGNGFAKGWKEKAELLEGILTPVELKAARRSTLDAFYTPMGIIDGMYAGLERLGVTGKARWLDPSTGTGHYIGRMPQHLRDNAKITAVEIDPLSARIAKALYGNEQVAVVNSGYEHVNKAPGSFDVAITNPPFGDHRIFDPVSPELSASIHNYFSLKTLKLLRDGGIMSFVISRYLMDAKDPEIRMKIAETADLLGAFRLPDSTFLENANTAAITDVLYFQKRSTPLPKDDKGKTIYPMWVGVGSVELPGKYADIVNHSINKYFIENESCVLGAMVPTTNQFGDTFTIKATGNPAEQLAKAVALHLPKNAYDPAATVFAQADENNKRSGVLRDLDNLPIQLYGVSVDTMFVYDNKVWVRTFDDGEIKVAEQITHKHNSKGELVPLSIVETDRIKRMVSMRMTYDTLIAKEMISTGDVQEVESLRTELRTQYNAFVKHHGFINRPTNLRLVRQDSSYVRISALEIDYRPEIKAGNDKKLPPSRETAKKASIFDGRVASSENSGRRKIESATDALAVSLMDYGKVNMPFIINALGKDENQIVSELGDELFLNPITSEYEWGPLYLSGNVREKLNQAEVAAQINPDFVRNITALKQNQPEHVIIEDVAINISAHWIPSNIIESFIRHLAEDDKLDVSARFIKAIGSWDITFKPNAILKRDYQTKRCNVEDILKSVVSGKSIRVMDLVHGKYHYNPDESAAGNAVVEKIRNGFPVWAVSDSARSLALEERYNELVNVHRDPVIKAPADYYPKGCVDRAVFNFRPHQLDFIFRGLISRNIMAVHCVGAGKTAAEIGLLMELKRTGLTEKSLLVVPNHLTGSWAKEIQRIYPSANVLLPEDKKDFHKSNRQTLFARIASNNLDVAVIGYSQIPKLPFDTQTAFELAEAELKELDETMEDGSMPAYLVKRMEKKKESVNERVNLLQSQIDSEIGVTWKQLGITSIGFDEFHNLKNLPFATALQARGLGNPNGSQRATKAHVLMESIRRSGGSISALTATPISNSLAELYTIFRYLNPKFLQDTGCEKFDTFVKTFALVESSLELDLTGQNYKLVDRLAKGVNLPEIMSAYRAIGHFVDVDDLKADTKAQNKKWYIPNIRGDKPELVVLKQSAAQLEQFADIRDRIEVLESGAKIDPKIDNKLKVLSDAKKTSLDPRMVDSFEDIPEISKIGELVKGTIAEAENAELKYGTKGLQIVFATIGIPKGAVSSERELVKQIIAGMESEDEDEAAKYAEQLEKYSAEEINDLMTDNDFSFQDGLRASLIGSGVFQPHEVASTSDARSDLERQRLYERCRLGEVKVLMSTPAKGAEGMNVQNLVIGEWIVDPPFRPSDISQMIGRVSRQGNELFEKYGDDFSVFVKLMATENTPDTWLYQLLEKKQVGFGELMYGKFKGRSMDAASNEIDIADVFGEMKSLSSGNESIRELHEVRLKIKALIIEESNQQASVSRYRRTKSSLEGSLKSLPAKIEALDLFRLAQEGFEPDGVIIESEVEGKIKAVSRSALHCELANGRIFLDAMDGGTALFFKCEEARREAVSNSVEEGKFVDHSVYIGKVNGIKMYAEGDASRKDSVYVTFEVDGGKALTWYITDFTSSSPKSFGGRIKQYLQHNIQNTISSTISDLNAAQKEYDNFSKISPPTVNNDIAIEIAKCYEIEETLISAVSQQLKTPVTVSEVEMRREFFISRFEKYANFSDQFNDIVFADAVRKYDTMLEKSKSGDLTDVAFRTFAASIARSCKNVRAELGLTPMVIAGFSKLPINDKELIIVNDKNKDKQNTLSVFEGSVGPHVFHVRRNDYLLPATVSDVSVVIAGYKESFDWMSDKEEFNNVHEMALHRLNEAMDLTMEGGHNLQWLADIEHSIYTTAKQIKNDHGFERPSDVAAEIIHKARIDHSQTAAFNADVVNDTLFGPDV